MRLKPTQQNLRDVGLDPWVWGTVVRWSMIYHAYLLRNGELHYDLYDLGEDHWDEWPEPSPIVKRSWKRASLDTRPDTWHTHRTQALGRSPMPDNERKD